MFDLATQYYKVTHDSIRRYDPHHLILGDRYEARAPLPVEVVKAAEPYVDVLSFQQFGPPEKVKADFEHWRQTIDIPILLADGAGSRKLPGGAIGQDGARYHRTLQVLQDNPACVGFHLCGAYLRNRVRRRGLRDELDQPDVEALRLIAAANRETIEWVKKYGK